MDIQDLKNRKLILLECISGSKAYGLSTPDSDTDIRGVYVLPKNQFYGFEYLPQISNESNDMVYYELKRFMELLSKNNPTLLELLSTPKESVLQKHLLLENLDPDYFLSKLCKDTFAGYAMTQIKKAKGLNKKIGNPIEKERKGVLDFCFVAHDQGSLPVKEWLKMNGWTQSNCGLSKIPHMHEVYGVYYDENTNYKGIIHHEQANEVSLSSIHRDAKPVAILAFNKSGYSQYCKEYKEYWQWVADRNEARYSNNVSHGKNYDAKNMMHTFRLLFMAKEIGQEGKINVWRNDRDFLLSIKRGDFEYVDLVKMAEEKIANIEEIYAKSSLPEAPDLRLIDQLLVSIRNDFYSERD